MEAGHISPIKSGIFRHLLPYRGRMDLAAKMLYLYQHFGVQKLLRMSGVLHGLRLDKMDRLLPDSAGSALKKTEPSGKKQIKVAYFMGCMTNLFFHETGEAVIALLEENGAEVVIPPQFCCGMPALFSGDMAQAKRLAEKNIAAFTGDYDYIVTDCASCLGALKRYGEFGLEGEKIAAKAIDFSHLLVDILGFQPQIAKAQPIPVTYHDPCHLKRQIRGREAPRLLLQRLSPLYEYVEADHDVCCGAAGSFNLGHYDLARKVGDQKVAALAKTGAKVITTSCPACLMQLRHIVGEQHLDIEVEHIALLCYRALRENKNHSHHEGEQWKSED